MRSIRDGARRWLRFVLDDAGVSATEYAILLGLLVLGAMVLIAGIGHSMQGIYDRINAEVATSGM